MATLTMGTPKRTGRPAKPPREKSERLWTTLPGAEYDEFCRRAAQAGVSLYAFLRTIIRASRGRDFRL